MSQMLLSFGQATIRTPVERYERRCPVHRVALVEVDLAKDGHFRAFRGVPDPQLRCPNGGHLVGIAVAVKFWNVVDTTTESTVFVGSDIIFSDEEGEEDFIE